jgi:ABC-type dipeptide/oligopeptide/nickel transport system permease component
VLSYLIRRIVFAIVLVFGVSSAAMLLTRLAPGDYAAAEAGLTGGRRAVEERRVRYGLDRPMLEQYRRWLTGAVRLDFGQSLAYDRPVSDLIPERAVNTAWLAAASLLLATAIGVPLGVITGSRRTGLLVELVRAASIVLLSMPPLLTSLFFVFLAGVTGWLPVGGMGDARHLVVPAAALGLPIAAMFERLQSQAMREVVDQPFVLAARARGVPRSRILWRDGLKASLRPLASMYGLIVATLLSGSFAVEWVTSWPGLGRLLLEALRARDVFLVAGCAATGSLLLACGTLLSDVALAVVDPRAGE